MGDFGRRDKYGDHRFTSMGASHAYKTGTLHTTAQSVVAAVTGFRIRVKGFRCTLAVNNATPADVVANACWLSDGTGTALIGLLTIPGMDATAIQIGQVYDTGQIVLPSEGVAGTAATALTIDATAIDAAMTFQLDVYYDLIV